MNKKRLELSDRVGLKSDRALMTEDCWTVFLLLVDGRLVELSTYGDCCANAYIQHVNNPEALFIAEVTGVDDLEQDQAEHECGVIDTWGHRIHTTRGTCVLDCRTEHNGYYGGYLDAFWVNELPTNVRPLEER